MEERHKHLFVFVFMMLLCIIMFFSCNHDSNQNNLLFPMDDLKKAEFIYAQATSEAITITDENAVLLLANFLYHWI